ncbi:MAG: hypothetical protein PHS02_03590 [Candidatus ainarchaeum sp.]|nr:hypothetical protein [Candidatus ainarchaeum sp.]
MAKLNLLVICGIFLLFLSLSSAAGCSAKSYADACANCPVDASGKMDASCYSGYKSSGITCVSTSYPIASGKYAAGQCPGIDACAQELQTCQNQYSSGNDSADCQEGSVAICYGAADECVKQAAVKCGEVEKQCPGSSAALIIPFLLMGFAALYKRR